MELFEGTSEPVVRNWHQTLIKDLAASLPDESHHPLIVAIDGRSGSGKSTLAASLAGELAASMVAADDLAWWAPMFGWADLAIEGVLRPFREGKPIDFTPPAWTEKGRTGSIIVPVDARIVVLEGVGASQKAFVDLIDVSIWVQSDRKAARRLGLARDIASGVNGDAREAEEFWDQWMESENAFLEADRPWDRADLIAAGTSDVLSAAQTVRIAVG